MHPWRACITRPSCHEPSAAYAVVEKLSTQYNRSYVVSKECVASDVMPNECYLSLSWTLLASQASSLLQGSTSTILPNNAAS
jgi:hypothetical protein